MHALSRGRNEFSWRQDIQCPPPAPMAIEAMFVQSPLRTDMMLCTQYDIVHLPSEAMQAHGLGNSPPSSPSQPPQSGSSRMFDCCSILANAAVVGDAFQWHIDADPAAMPPSTWTATFGDYCNGEPGKYDSCSNQAHSR